MCKYLLLSSLLLLLVTGYVTCQEASQDDQAVASKQVPSGIYAYTAYDIDGKNVSLSQYMGKVALVVNIASNCSFAERNYKALQLAHERYGPFGFVVLGFPCNQFDSKEPGTEADIKKFAQETYNVTFPLFAKVDVKGDNINPIFAFMKEHLPAEESGGSRFDISYNWHKYLINKQGYPVKRYASHYEAGVIEREVYKELTGFYHGEQPKKKSKKKAQTQALPTKAESNDKPTDAAAASAEGTKNEL